MKIDTKNKTIILDEPIRFIDLLEMIENFPDIDNYTIQGEPSYKIDTTWIPLTTDNPKEYPAQPGFPWEKYKIYCTY